MKAESPTALKRRERELVARMATAIAATGRPLADRRGIVSDLEGDFESALIAAHVAAATKAARGLRAQRGALVTKFHR